MALVAAIIVILSVATIGLSNMKATSTSISTTTATTPTIPTTSTTTSQIITPIAQTKNGTNNASSNNNDNASLVKFVANFEMIKGHIGKAEENKNSNELELAKAHAGHPIAEHYIVLEPLINQTDSQLSSALKQSLTSLVDKVATTSSAAQFKSEADKAIELLNQAYSKVIPQAQKNDTKFNAHVLIALVTQVTEEYEEGVKDGKVVQVVEYQDAQAFVGRAEAVFDKMRSNLTSHERDVVQDQFKQLDTSMTATKAPSTIDDHVKAIVIEVGEGAGMENTSVATAMGHQTMTTNSTDTAIYIQNIRNLLKQVSIQYQQGNYTGAETLAVSAYLDNFENVEGPLIQANQTQLKVDTEKMLREDLRDMIKNRVEQQVLDAQIAAINAKLDEVGKVLS